MAATEPRIVQSANHSSARIDIFEAGTHLVGVDAIAVNVNPSRHGLRAGLHLTREQARDLHAVLGEVLS